MSNDKRTPERREWERQYRLKNKRRIAETRRQWRLENLETTRASETAYKRKWYEAHRQACPTCGKPIFHTSKACTKHKRHLPSGPTHPAWKGGKRKTKGGYIQMYQREHPRASKDGRVYEHIVVWEEAHGKPVPKGWIIHHLNGVRDDNLITNLVAMPDKKHRTLLQAKAKRIQELEALLRQQSQLI